METLRLCSQMLVAPTTHKSDSWGFPNHCWTTEVRSQLTDAVRTSQMPNSYSWYHLLFLPSPPNCLTLQLFKSVFFFFCFLMWTIFKDIIEFVTIIPLLCVLIFWPWGMWDFNSPIQDQTHTLCTGRSFNSWTAGDVPRLLSFGVFFPSQPSHPTLSRVSTVTEGFLLPFPLGAALHFWEGLKCAPPRLAGWSANLLPVNMTWFASRSSQM